MKCGECHVNGVYNKIDATCESCHSSPVDHVYSISTNCAACHTLQGWDQAVGNHTNLPLTEKHSNLACVKCHPNDVYREVPTLCESCHVRPAEHFNTTYSCESCHTPVGWTPAEYDHSFYPLENGHQAVQCAQCHVDHRYVGTPKKCELCHTAPNDHVYGIDTRCEACHVTEGWKPATASHSSFPLADGHASLQCSQCHADTKYSETPKTCETCHTLPEGHFNTQRFNTTVGCSSCHVTSGWSSASFDHSFYSLTEAHTSASCTDCHVGGQYSGTPQSCSSCHGTPQNHPINNNNNCVQCHRTSAWSPASYDHSGFTLTGSHASVSCSSCHSSGVYSGLSTSCASCHSPPADHPIPNPGSCGSCHSTSGFGSASGGHTGFPLTGAHGSLACSSCHSGGVYTGLSTSCASCHQTPSTHTGLSTNCFSCHSGNTFSPSIYVHPQTGPHVPSGDRRLACSSCHRPSYSAASCTGSRCHSSTPRGG